MIERSCIALVVSALLLGCGAKPPPAPAVVKAAPPADDGKAAKGGSGGQEHYAALEQLRTAPLSTRTDKQDSVALDLPDGEHWTRVRFWTVKSLFGFRYGKEHHAIVGGYVLKVADNRAPGACTKAFEEWARPWVETFDVDVKRERDVDFAWLRTTGDKPIMITMHRLAAETAVLGMQDSYKGTYVGFPAWEGGCLIVGAAVPERGDPGRAEAVRERLASEVLTKARILTAKEPPEVY